MSVFSELIKTLDDVFSKYIRQKYAGSTGRVKCYTCMSSFRWQDMDCGHFIPRTHMSTRFNEDNCRPQCKACNQCNDGNLGMFEVKLRYELGTGRFHELEALRRNLQKFARYELEEMIVKYKKLLK